MVSVQEGLPGVVRHTGEVELEGEALLEAVALVHALRVDAVDRLFRRTDDRGVLLGDLLGDLPGRVVELTSRTCGLG